MPRNMVENSKKKKKSFSNQAAPTESPVTVQTKLVSLTPQCQFSTFSYGQTFPSLLNYSGYDEQIHYPFIGFSFSMLSFHMEASRLQDYSIVSK